MEDGMLKIAKFPLALLCVAMLCVAGCSRVSSDWKAAQQADTSEAYQEFLHQHPDSEFTGQAQARVKQLAEDRDWQQAAQADTLDAYQQFLAQHADSKWAQEARVRIENFQQKAAAPPPVATAAPMPSPMSPAAPGKHQGAVAPPPTGKAHHEAQLGAYATKARAESAWKRLEVKFPTQLKGLSPHYVPGTYHGKPVYRLRVPTHSPAKLCSALKKQSQPCVPVSG
jgi:sporulation related protein